MSTKNEKIYMQTWLNAHERRRVVDTDQWYLDLANDLLPLIRESLLCTSGIIISPQQVALTVALYLEDCVANGGSWRQFIHWHLESYGRYLPFYTLSERYMPDEVNSEDIAFLLWATSSPVSDLYSEMENPLDDDLLDLANEIFFRIDPVFESAPISDDLAEEWLMEGELMQKVRKPLPVVVPGEKLPTNVGLFLEASKGESLMFFDSYEALRLFFIHSLKWEDEEDSLLPDLKEFENFVLYANPKGLLIGPDVAAFFADKRNPLYNAEEAAKMAYELFCEQGLCPFDLLKYGMEHDLLPDAQFLFKNGKALLHDNWDFVARWFLGEYYEGE